MIENLSKKTREMEPAKPIQLKHAAAENDCGRQLSRFVYASTLEYSARHAYHIVEFLRVSGLFPLPEVPFTSELSKCLERNFRL